MDLVIDELKAKYTPIAGPAVWLSPENQSIQIDYTTPMGACSNLFYSLIFQMPKWGFSMAKVDEWMTVTPTHVDAYNLTIAQKQKLEGSIKAGLASIAQAVSDYELISHDYRRYREIFDYFVKGESDEHVLRSLFIDRVDAFTGENYSLVTMARRWPTIITDFIRMRADIDNVDHIRQELDVSAAEATILKTKNELYKEWKLMFKPVVEQRLMRFKSMMDARKKSVEQYKKWLKPYVSRHKMMKDSLEESPAGERTNRFMTPGFGQAVGSTGIRLWAWKPFITEEVQRPEAFAEQKKGKADFALDPYDDWVKDKLPLFKQKYGVEITDEIVENVKKAAVGGQRPHVPQMDPNEPYYLLFDITLDRSIIRTAQPEGGDIEDMMFAPLQTWILSQNVLLLYLIELEAIKMSFEKEIDEIIGVQDNNEETLNNLRDEIMGKKEQKKAGIKDLVHAAGSAKNTTVNAFKPFSKYLFRPGPYESNFKERLTKVYMVGSGQQFGIFVNWIKGKMGVK